MNYYNEIKNEIINNEVTKQVKNYSINKSDLESKYKIGKLLSEAGKHYGEGIIKEYSIKLTKEFGKGYTFTSLTRMKKFYLLTLKLATMSQHLTFGHYVELLPIEDINIINYYINLIERENLSVRQLRQRIKSNEYERLPESTKLKLSTEIITKPKITDNLKNPIIIRNKNSKDINYIKEKLLKELILEDIEHFMKELGSGYAFIGSEYKLSYQDKNIYVDILLFNIIFNSYVVIELKTEEFKEEYIGQVLRYISVIDNTIKEPYQNSTIGIVICKKLNSYYIEYTTDDRIKRVEYKII